MEFDEHMRDQIRMVVREEVDRLAKRMRREIHIETEDPILFLDNNRNLIEEQLKTSANFVGRNVLVGRRVILWGGLFPDGLGLRIYDGVRIYDDCKLVIDRISPDSGIQLGANVAMNFGCYIEGSGGIIVGERTIFGPNVVVISSGHRIDAAVEVQSSGKHFGRVNIGSDVWIGANAVIRAGVAIGDRSVIGAGAVVTHDVPPASVAAGNPARIMRSID